MLDLDLMYQKAAGRRTAQISTGVAAWHWTFIFLICFRRQVSFRSHAGKMERKNPYQKPWEAKKSVGRKRDLLAGPTYMSLLVITLVRRTRPYISDRPFI